MNKITPETLDAIMQADQAIAWASITSSMEIEIDRMNRHALTYIDLHPEPVQQEPSSWAIWLGAAVALVCICTVLALGFAAGRGLL